MGIQIICACSAIRLCTHAGNASGRSLLLSTVVWSARWRALSSISSCSAAPVVQDDYIDLDERVQLLIRRPICESLSHETQ